jgi:hypothetical protein
MVEGVLLATETTYAYLAGIIDIRGFISISRKRDGSYATRIGFSDSSPIIPNLALAILAGRIFQSRPRKATYHTFYMWEATHRQAREPLVRLKPHLRLKQLHAEIALQMLALHDAGTRLVSLENRAARQRLFEEMDRLNRDRRRRKHPITG